MVTRPNDVRVDVVVLTALDLEYAAVRAHLTGLRTYTDANGTRYETGETRGHRSRVALALTGHGNLAAAALTTRAVTWFRPKALIFTGIAGGCHDDVAPGDVVVASWVHNHQSGKAVDAGFQPRNMGWQLSHALEQDARDVARVGAWAQLLPDDTTVPAVHVKPIVSGDTVVDTRDGHVPKVIAERYGDAIAVDMESGGVASAAHHNGFHHAVTVRGISDLADGTKRDTDRLGWQKRAAAHAAAFAVALADRVAAGPGSMRPVGTSPYRGLAAFGEGDAELFFGRAETADDLAATVSGRKFVTVVGRSGSGKSSLVHAGLVPRMRKRGWAIAAFRPLPGVPAAITLAGGLLPLLLPGLGRTEALAHRAMLADAITGGRLMEIVGDVLAATGKPRLLVCVDQFEELVASREDDARELAGLLVGLTTGPAHVVLTTRAETLDVAVHRLGLGDVARNSVFLLTPMTAAQLREVIEGPVRQTDVTFDDGLVTRILDAARDAPGALTLTQFALTRLWDEQDHGRLTHHAYDAFGGVAGALTSYADRVWSDWLDEPRRALSRRLLVQLVRHEGDDVVRRTARGDELAQEMTQPAHDLAAARLLVIGADATGDVTVDLAHAALATHWLRLREWLAEDRDFRAWQEDLRESVRRTESLRGPRLATALRWLRTQPHAIPPRERDFVLASRRRQRLRTTAWRGLLAVILVLLTVATAFAVNLQRRGDELADELRRNAAAALTIESRERIESDPEAAALLSVAAYRSNESPEVLAHLAGEYLRHRDTDRMVNPGVGHITDVAVSADGRMAAVAGLRATAMMRVDGDSPVVTRGGGDIRRVAISGDGRFLAGSTDFGRLELWRPDGSVDVLHDNGRELGGPDMLRFDGSGARLLASDVDGLRVWDVASGDEVTVAPSVAQQASLAVFESVWFGPDGESVVVATDETDQLLRMPLDGSPPTMLTTVPPGTLAVVSGDGRTAITCVDELVYWDVATATVRKRLPAPLSSCPASSEAVVDHSGRFLISSSLSEGDTYPRDAVLLIDATTDAPARFAVPATEAAIDTYFGLAATAAGARLVTGVGSTLAVTDLARSDFTALGGQEVDPVLSPDLRYGLSRSSEGGDTLHLWDIATGSALAHVANPDSLEPLRFTADGAYLLAVEDNIPEYVAVFRVPELKLVAKVRMPAQMRENREQFPGRMNIFCVADLPADDEVVIVHAGLAVRVDVGSGELRGQPLRLWRTEKDVERLAEVLSCGARPGHAEFALDTASGVEVWRLADGTRTTLPVSGVGWISSLRFSSDGRLLAVVGFDGTMEIWDVERRQRDGGTRKVIAAGLGVQLRAFPSTDRVVLRGQTGVRVWDLDGDAAIADIRTDFPGSARVTPDGRTLVYWGQTGLTRLPLDAGKWADHLCRAVGRDLTDAERRALPSGGFTGRIC